MSEDNPLDRLFDTSMLILEAEQFGNRQSAITRKQLDLMANILECHTEMLDQLLRDVKQLKADAGISDEA